MSGSSSHTCGKQADDATSTDARVPLVLDGTCPLSAQNPMMADRIDHRHQNKIKCRTDSSVIQRVRLLRFQDNGWIDKHRFLMQSQLLQEVLDPKSTNTIEDSIWFHLILVYRYPRPPRAITSVVANKKRKRKHANEPPRTDRPSPLPWQSFRVFLS